jgi:hypothetical protein
MVDWPKWNSVTERWKRREKMCLGYNVSYDHDTGTYTASIYSVQNGRTNAHLGDLKLQRDEWDLFHTFAYGNLEDLGKPYEEEIEDFLRE